MFGDSLFDLYFLREPICCFHSLASDFVFRSLLYDYIVNFTSVFFKCNLAAININAKLKFSWCLCVYRTCNTIRKLSSITLVFVIFFSSMFPTSNADFFTWVKHVISSFLLNISHKKKESRISVNVDRKHPLLLVHQRRNSKTVGISQSTHTKCYRSFKGLTTVTTQY